MKMYTPSWTVFVRLPTVTGFGPFADAAPPDVSSRVVVIYLPRLRFRST
jgi:hypothetical protein